MNDDELTDEFINWLNIHYPDFRPHYPITACYSHGLQVYEEGEETDPLEEASPHVGSNPQPENADNYPNPCHLICKRGNYIAWRRIDPKLNPLAYNVHIDKTRPTNISKIIYQGRVAVRHPEQGYWDDHCIVWRRWDGSNPTVRDIDHQATKIVEELHRRNL
jgi:hypothetical protein